MSNEELEYDVGADEKETLVEVSEESVEQEEGSAASAEPQEAELEEYSNKVQKRIDKLTARLRETQRREEAAIAYARNVQQKASQLEDRFKRTDQERVVATQGRLQTEVATLKQIIRKAREEGDIDTETEAQERLTAAYYDQRRMSDAEKLPPKPSRTGPGPSATTGGTTSCTTTCCVQPPCRTRPKSRRLGRSKRMVWQRRVHDTGSTRNSSTISSY